MWRASVVFGVALLAVSLGTLTTGVSADDGAARATLRNAGGDKVGIVQLIQQDGTVLVRARVEGLPEGFHGFHVHANNNPANGDGCVAPSFLSADGHYNPGGLSHDDHAGDMPVLLVTGDGSGAARFKTDRFAVSDVLGRAIIVHALADNYANIPARYGTADAATLATGDAGGRIVCGVIEPTE